MACIVPDIEKVKRPDTQKDVDLSFFDGVEVFLYDCRPIWKTEESEQLQKAERYYSQLICDGKVTESDVRAICQVRQQESRKQRPILIGHRVEYRSGARAFIGALRSGYSTIIVRANVFSDKPISVPPNFTFDADGKAMLLGAEVNGLEIEQIFNDYE